MPRLLEAGHNNEMQNRSRLCEWGKAMRACVCVLTW